MKKQLLILQIYILFLILSNISILHSQKAEKSDNLSFFYFDAIVFRSDSMDKSRLDVFIAIPYQSLTFVKAENEEYYSKFVITITCFDFTGNVALEKTENRIVRAKTYAVSQGAFADFDRSILGIYLPEGTFKIKVEVSDLLSKVIYERNREISVVNYRKYPFALSGIMLVSSVYDSEGNQSITPYLSDNVSSLSDGFFGFFETYNQKEADTVDFVYQYLLENNIKFQSAKIPKYIPSGDNQEYIKISKPPVLSSGSYFLKIIAMKHSNDTIISESKFLAVSQRTVTYNPTFAGNVIEDLDLSIKELRYVATNAQLSYINEGVNYNEKLKRFQEFWDALDPTPNTKRNEAFDEYYSRVQYANEKFKSYTQGWMTDMGMVYIIFGPPNTVDRRQDYYNPSRYYERWTYLSNREFIFVDSNGFGDFRLINGTSVVEKYDYNRGK